MKEQNSTNVNRWNYWNIPCESHNLNSWLLSDAEESSVCRWESRGSESTICGTYSVLQLILSFVIQIHKAQSKYCSLRSIRHSIIFLSTDVSLFWRSCPHTVFQEYECPWTAHKKNNSGASKCDYSRGHFSYSHSHLMTVILKINVLNKSSESLQEKTTSWLIGIVIGQRICGIRLSPVYSGRDAAFLGWFIFCGLRPLLFGSTNQNSKSETEDENIFIGCIS